MDHAAKDERRRTLNKLNGWQRAWVVIALVWAVPMLLFLWSNMPQSPSRLKKEHDAIIARAKADAPHPAPGEWVPPEPGILAEDFPSHTSSWRTR